MTEYLGRQFVGIDLHRRRSVIVRTTESGEVLEATQILNDVGRLNSVMARAGEDPEVVLEATYGWYWAVDALQEVGARVHLAHPLGVKASSTGGSRTTSATPPIWPTCCGWVGCRRRGSRHRRPGSCASWCGTGPSWSGCVRIARAEIHAVLAKCGIQVQLSDLFSIAGNQLLDRFPLSGPYAARVQSLRRLIEDLEEEIELFERLTRGRLVADPGYTALQQLPGIGPILAAVFTAEVGDITRFHTAAQLACWTGLTPKHHESDTHVHRGRITKQGSRLVRWAAVESVKRLGPTTVVGAYKARVADRRGKNIGTVAAARKQTEFVFYALRDHHVRALHPPRPRAAPAA